MKVSKILVLLVITLIFVPGNDAALQCNKKFVPEKLPPISNSVGLAPPSTKAVLISLTLNPELAIISPFVYVTAPPATVFILAALLAVFSAEDNNGPE